MADETETQNQKPNDGMTAAERAELAELRAAKKSAELEKVKADEAIARANGEVTKLSEIWEKRHKEATDEAATLRQYKAQREAEDRRQSNSQRLAEVAGVTLSPVLKGLIREAEASGRFKADADQVSENDLKTWAKELQKMAPEAFKAPKGTPPLLVKARATEDSDMSDEDAAIVARAKRAFSGQLPEHLRRS